MITIDLRNCDKELLGGIQVMRELGFSEEEIQKKVDEDNAERLKETD